MQLFRSGCRLLPRLSFRTCLEYSSGGPYSRMSYVAMGMELMISARRALRCIHACLTDGVVFSCVHSQVNAVTQHMYTYLHAMNRVR